MVGFIPLVLFFFCHVYFSYKFFNYEAHGKVFFIIKLPVSSVVEFLSKLKKSIC